MYWKGTVSLDTVPLFVDISFRELVATLHEVKVSICVSYHMSSSERSTESIKLGDCVSQRLLIVLCIVHGFSSFYHCIDVYSTPGVHF